LASERSSYLGASSLGRAATNHPVHTPSIAAILKSMEFVDFTNQNSLEPATATADLAVLLKSERQGAALLVNKYVK
jgi:hypothetical protein